MCSCNTNSPFARGVAFGLHTVAVYFWALHLSPWLVGRWFAWFAPLFHIAANAPSGDWYLQHLALSSIIPALVAGYLIVRQHHSPATWAWIIPTLVLGYKMLRYQAGYSVLIGRTSISSFGYFFHVLHRMPTLSSPGGDPARVLAQMVITAPFYAGVAYSVGALCSKLDLLNILFRFEREEWKEGSEE